MITYYTRGAELISLSRPGEKHYYLHDGHGSVRALSDADGQVTDTYLFDAFGNFLTKTGTTENDFLYTGEQYDANTGFYYLRARYMNPSTGTFTSPDAYAGTIFDPVSLHKYLYANANPVMNRDPSGYQTLTLTEEVTVCDIIAILCQVTVPASVMKLISVGTTVAIFVGNNPMFVDLCMRIAAGDIPSDSLRDFIKDLYNQVGDKVTDFINDVTGKANDAGSNYNNSSAGNPPPPVDPDIINRIREIIREKGIQFSDKFLDDKYSTQVADRGWSEQMIRDVIENPYKTAEAFNKHTGNLATRFYINDQYYVVVDNITGKIIQVADLTKGSWQ